MPKWIKFIIDFVSLKILSPFNWSRIKFLFTGRYFNLLNEDREHARKLMAHAHYIWVTRRRTHLTSYLISFSDLALSLFMWARSGFNERCPSFGYWTHSFINFDNDEIIEAVAKGVQKVYFDDAFDCDSVAALAPAFIPDHIWKDLSREVIAEAEKQIGKKYDTIFNIADESEVSCIEMIRLVLKRLVNYEIYFRDFEQSIKLYKNLTPQLLYDSKSFRVVWEARR